LVLDIEDGDDVEEDDRDGDPTEDEDDDEVRADKRRKRARKTSSATAGRRRGSGAKMNGVAKGTKGKGGRKPRKSDAVNVDLKENTNECPMLGYSPVIILLVNMQRQCWMIKLPWMPRFLNGLNGTRKMNPPP